MSHHSNSHQPSDRCSFCYGLIIFDHCLDLNTCIRCGAQETTRGWQLGTLPSEESGSGGKHLLDKLRLAAQTLDPELQVPRLGFSNH